MEAGQRDTERGKGLANGRASEHLAADANSGDSMHMSSLTGAGA